MLKFGRGQLHYLLGADVGAQTAIHDVVWQGGLEGAVTDEEDDGIEAIFLKSEGLGQGPDMQGVLVQWVLETTFLPVDLLGPLGLTLVAKDPAFVVLGFDDKDAVAGNDHVVDLGAPLAVGAWQVEIVVDLIGGWVERLEGRLYHALAKPTFELCGCEDLEED